MNLRKIILTTSILSILIPFNICNATIQPISDIYTEGVHRLNVDEGVYKATVKLITEQMTTVVISDKDDDVIFLSRLKKGHSFIIEEYTKDSSITIIGPGEVAITFERVS